MKTAFKWSQRRDREAAILDEALFQWHSEYNENITEWIKHIFHHSWFINSTINVKADWLAAIWSNGCMTWFIPLNYSQNIGCLRLSAEPGLWTSGVSSFCLWIAASLVVKCNIWKASHHPRTSPSTTINLFSKLNTVAAWHNKLCSQFRSISGLVQHTSAQVHIIVWHKVKQ